ncbi:Predicted nucleotidyltransferase [Clostridium amylolyticum]|uniref:tRNA(Met) cytidine acetate ligase n=1 Tax=Clostridium amylolyticum TaxID=1121298 RepID=A0A1M6D749_9CLOT|nr:nucleotidyltransferase [Clostridium amylolyticum]SHI69055.1 Predicted nucleotidyltransferase [Clostridium amylolyticum]
MKNAAIICEYNPLHKGHVYHINHTREYTNCHGIVCLMSGNFMQRGIPALMDKWKRAEIAIKSGADLVIELPSIFSVSSAEFFAKGAIDILDSMGVVDYVSFGSESGDIALIEKLAIILSEEPMEYKESLKTYLNRGIPFAKARAESLKDYISLKDSSLASSSKLTSLLQSSNNILALEYCKALYKNNSKIKPITLTRMGDNYNETTLTSNFASATAIRNALRSKDIYSIKDYVPESTFQELIKLNGNNYKFIFEDSMFPYLKYKLMLNRDLHKLPDVSEGLDNRIYSAISNSKSIQELILKSKTKRYTYTRINRILCQYFLGFEEYDIKSLRKSEPSYVRILAFNHRGREIIKDIKNTSSMEIVNKMPKKISDMLELDIKTTKAYSILNANIDPSEDFLKSPKYV